MGTKYGEIAVDDISIHGAKFYQNSFLLEGLSITSTLNPAGGIDKEESIVNQMTPRLGGPSQALNIDSSLIGSLVVYDSFVPAKYSSFEGGVVSVELKEPSKDKLIKGLVSVSHTSSKLTRINHDEKDEKNFDESRNGAQPHFKKFKYRLNLEAKAGDLSALFAYTQESSVIKIRPYAAVSFSPQSGIGSKLEKTRRKNENFLLKLGYEVSPELKLTNTLTYAPYKRDTFIERRLDGKAVFYGGGWSNSLRLAWEEDDSFANATFGFGVFDHKKIAENKNLIGWKKSNKKPWGASLSHEGAGPDVRQRQQELSLALEAGSSFDLGKIEHKISGGLSIKQTWGSYENLVTGMSITGATPLITNCAPSDPWCLEDDSYKDVYKKWNSFNNKVKGQYLYVKQLYLKGKARARFLQLGAFLEDDMKIGLFRARLGARYDYDSFMRKHTIAPRILLGLDLFDDKTKIELGFSRYYGGSTYANALQDEASILIERYERPAQRFPRNALGRTLATTDEEAGKIPSTYQENFTLKKSGGKKSRLFRRLKAPYSNEIALNITQDIADFRLSLKYTDRRYKRQIMLVGTKDAGLSLDTNIYNEYSTTYTNSGKSSYSQIALGFSSITPLEFWGMKHSFDLGLSKQKSKSYHQSYTDNDDRKDPLISYNDKIMRRSQMPARDFNSPYSLRASTTHELERFFLSSFMSLQSPSYYLDQKMIMHEGEKITAYWERRSKLRFNLDLRLGATLKIKETELFANVDILNVTNAKNVGYYQGQVSKYQNGRAYWFELGLRF